MLKFIHDFRGAKENTAFSDNFCIQKKNIPSKFSPTKMKLIQNENVKTLINNFSNMKHNSPWGDVGGGRVEKVRPNDVGLLNMEGVINPIVTWISGIGRLSLFWEVYIVEFAQSLLCILQGSEKDHMYS